MKGINEIGIVRSRAAWDFLWQSAIADYWQKIDDSIIKNSHLSTDSLFNIFQDLGVKNIERIMNKLGECEGIGFKAYKNIEKEYFIIIKSSSDIDQVTPSFIWQNAYSQKNSWTNIAGGLTVKIPPYDTDENKQLAVLAKYSKLGLFYPFGSVFSFPYDHEFNDNKEIVQLNELIKNELDNVSIYESGNILQSEQIESSRLPEFHERQQGDRGGADGIDEDFRWIQFVPRMVAYNWAETEKEQIKNNTDLAGYPQLLENLSFTIPKGLKITIKYADINTFNNKYSYTSILEVVIPKPPQKNGYSPIALADLKAKRSNEPFTCT